jgi:hypothetical protein
MVELRAGIGKTPCGRRLPGAREAGMTILAARGGEPESEFPYGLVRQLFERVLAAATPATRERLLSGAARTAGTLLAAESSDGVSVPEGRRSFAAVHALYWLTADLAAEALVMLAAAATARPRSTGLRAVGSWTLHDVHPAPGPAGSSHEHTRPHPRRP